MVVNVNQPDVRKNIANASKEDKFAAIYAHVKIA